MLYVMLLVGITVTVLGNEYLEGLKEKCETYMVWNKEVVN